MARIAQYSLGRGVGESRFSSSSLVMWSITYLALSIMLMIDMVYLFSS